MKTPMVVCFSHNKQTLNRLSGRLLEHFAETENYKSFISENEFLDSLKTLSTENQSIKLIVIDLNGFGDSTSKFIDEIIALNNNSKLLISDSISLVEIQQKFKTNSSLHYLVSPFNNMEFTLAVNLANIRENNLLQLKEEKIEAIVQERVQKLIEANQAKDSLLSVISHDLKSPFCAILGLTDVLLNDWKNLSEEDKLEIIGDISKTSTDTFKLLESLLEWSKLQKEKLQVSIDEIQIHELVDSTLKITKNTVSVKGIKIENNIGNNVKVNADKNMIAAVVRNLVSNAVRDAKPGGNIHISAQEEENTCTICVSDNGTGIVSSPGGIQRS